MRRIIWPAAIGLTSKTPFLVLSRAAQDAPATNGAKKEGAHPVARVRTTLVRSRNKGARKEPLSASAKCCARKPMTLQEGRLRYPC